MSARNVMLVVAFDIPRGVWVGKLRDHDELVGWPAVLDFLDHNDYRIVSSCVDYYDARVATTVTPPSPTSLDARIYRLFAVREG